MPKLGTHKHPAIVRVHTDERAREMLEICQEHGWQVIVGVEPSKPEDVSDVEHLLSPPEPARATMTVGRNEPCPCGSGKKFKKCHGGPPLVIPAKTVPSGLHGWR